MDCSTVCDLYCRAMLAVDRAHFVQTYTGVPGEIAYQVMTQQLTSTFVYVVTGRLVFKVSNACWLHLHTILFGHHATAAWVWASCNSRIYVPADQC
jgi:hypothetical protein